MDSLKIMTQNKEFVISDFDMPKQIQNQARLLCFQYNKTSPNNKNKKREILNKLLGTCSNLTFIEPSFQCDYGLNIHTSGLVFIIKTNLLPYTCLF